MSSSLTPFTGGESEIELAVGNVRQLFAALDERYPELGNQLETELAVAIDGEIYQDALLQAIGGESEVFLFPKIAGG